MTELTQKRKAFIKDSFTLPEEVSQELNSRAAQTGNKSFIVVKALRKYFGWDDTPPPASVEVERENVAV